MSKVLERYAIYAVPVVLAAAAAVGILVSPGSGVLVIVATLLVAVLAVGYLAVDALLSSDGLAPAAELQEGEVATLRGEKASILQVLRDLEVERDLGKVSQADFEALDRQFRGRAIEVMKRIDRDLAAYKKKAEALIAEKVAQAGGAAVSPPAIAPAEGEATAPSRACPVCEASVDTETVFCKKCGCRVACGTCSAPLDADSVFCKKCGAKVEGTRAEGAGDKAESK